MKFNTLLFSAILAVAAAAALPAPAFAAAIVVTESGGSVDVAEGGATDTFTVHIDDEGGAAPTVDTTVTITVSDSETTVDTATLTFTSVNYASDQTVTVTAVDDSTAEGTHTGTISLTSSNGTDAAYNGLTANATASITDNETAGVTVAESGGSTDIDEDGTTDTYTVVLTSQPASDVVIDITSDVDVSTDVASLTFTNGNWDTAQTVTVTAVDDTTVEDDHTGSITHAVDAASSDNQYDAETVGGVTANITDNDSASVSMPGSWAPGYGPNADGVPGSEQGEAHRSEHATEILAQIHELRLKLISLLTELIGRLEA